MPDRAGANRALRAALNMAPEECHTSIVDHGLSGAGAAAIIRCVTKRVRLRKREIALAIGVGALGAAAATGILSDGFGGPGSVFKNVPGLAPPDSPENPRR